jgi:hypothetical protein
MVVRKNNFTFLQEHYVMKKLRGHGDKTSYLFRPLDLVEVE